MLKNSRIYHMLCNWYRDTLMHQRLLEHERAYRPASMHANRRPRDARHRQLLRKLAAGGRRIASGLLADDDRPRWLNIEPLEARVYLSGDTLSFDSTDPFDLTLRAQEQDGVTLVQLVAVDGTVVAGQALDATSDVLVTGSGGDDALRIDDSVVDLLPVQFDGAGGGDALYGPGSDSTWNVTGDGSGELGLVDFTDVEDLVGAAGNEDNFVFTPGGSLAGGVDGGDGGFDTVTIEGGEYDRVEYTATGPQSGSIDLDGNVIHYDGVEPLANSGTAADVIINTTAGDDQILVQSDLLTPGNIVIRSQNDPPSFELTSIATPTSSLTINAGDGDDVIIVQDLTLFDTSSRTLTLNGEAGDDLIDVTDFRDKATLNGGPNNDTLIGGRDNDTIDGGDGIDTVNETGESRFVGSTITITDTSLNISSTTVTSVDTLASIERAVLRGNEVDSSGFTGQLVFVQGVPEWEERGPGQVSDANVRLGDDSADDRIVTGAIQDVAVHPSDPNTIYIASVNGGVWKTEDGGSNWDALTEEFPTLSMSVITLDFDDPEIIYAGTGKTSSFRNEGGAAIGVLKSEDGGLTWKVIGQNDFAGDRVTGIVAKGNTVVVGTNAFNNAMWVSSDGGDNFTSPPMDSDGVDNDGDGIVDEVIAVGSGSGTTIANGGSGYAVGDIVSFPAAGAITQPRYQVTAVDAMGAVTNFSVDRFGEFPAASVANPVAMTGGSGAGLTMNMFTATSEMGRVTDLFGIVIGGNLEIYAGIRERGVFRSTDGGVTWASLNGDLPTNTVVDSIRVRVTVSAAGTNPVYAAFIENQDDGERISGLFRLADPDAGGGLMWQAMDIPGAPGADMDSDLGIHPGGQASSHFSFVADPGNTNFVFVGGDTTIVQTAGVWTAQVWRGDSTQPSGSQWLQLTNSNANGTSPHPDSRNMVFDMDGNILQVDDGGIFKLTNPNNNSTREWVPMIGDLSLMEFSSVAYDPINDIILGGAQDNGVVIQSKDDADDWFTASISTGDGEIVQVAVKDGASTLYFSDQELGNFGRIQNGDPSTTIEMQLEVDGTGFFDDTGVAFFDPAIPFATEYVVNAVDNTRLMIGTTFIYETLAPAFDLGSIFPPFEEVNTDLELWGGVSGGSPPVGTNFQLDQGNFARINALAYGGFFFDGAERKGDADVAYAATRNSTDVFVRQVGDSGFTVTNWNAGARAGRQVLDLVLHPDDWTQLFVLTSNGVFHGKRNDTMGTAAIEYDWTDLTGQLGNVSSNLQSIAIFQKSTGAMANDASDDTFVVMVGGLGGVFKTEVDLSGLMPAAPPNLLWSEYGTGLPNLIVTDLRYDTMDDLLLAGTLGRGAWVVENASETLGVDPVLRIEGHDTDPDQIRLVRDAIEPWMLDIRFDGEDTDTATMRLSDVSKIEIVGNGGDDIVQIDRTQGAIFVAGGIDIDGGTGSDNLELINGGALPGNANLAGSTWTITGTDPFGIQASHQANVMNITSPASEVAMGTGDALLAAPAEEDLIAGLKNLFDSSGAALIESLLGENLAGIDAASLISGLGGTLARPSNPLRFPDDPVSRVAPNGLSLVDTGVTVLQRFFESGLGGFDLRQVIEQGPTALADALQALDPDGVVNQTGIDFSDISYDVQLTKQLGGLINLKVVGDALVDSLGITDIADALEDAINFEGSVEIAADITLDISFGMDADGFFVGVDAAAPEVALSNIRVVGDASVNGDFGFLAAALTNVNLALEDGLELRFDVLDPGTLAADDRVRLNELRDVTAEFAVNSPGTPETPDVVFSADLDVHAALPGLDFTVFETDIALSWDEIQDSMFSVDASGADAGALLTFLKLDLDDLLSKFTDLKDDLAAVAGDVDFDIPFLDISFSGLVDVIDIFDERVLSQLSIDSLPSFSTAQGLVTTLASSLTSLTATDEIEDESLHDLISSRNVQRTLEDLGLSYDSGTGELTFQVDAEFGFDLSEALDFGFNLEEGLADLSASADANLDVKAEIMLTLGLDLDDLEFSVDTLLDNFFIRDAAIVGSFTASVDDFDASARLGFLDVGVVDGTASLTGSLTVALTDPGTNAADGRIDLRELGAALSDIGSLIDVDLDGSANFQLPLEAPFLGISASPDTTIGINIPDLGDPDSIMVTTPATPDFSELFNFTNMNAGTFVGLLAQLTSWLDDFRNSETFANFDVPLVGPALDEILGFADQFRDAVLFDDGDDDVDGANTLAGDVNSALDAAGLSDRLRAEGEGDHLRLVATDLTVESFSLTASGGNELGFGTSQSAALDLITLKLVGTSPAPSNGQLTGDVTFNVTIDGGTPVPVTVAMADTTDNERVGNDESKLVDDGNSPTFNTAQQMALKLGEILGAGDILEYDPVDDTLTFTLDISGVFGQLDLPVDFNLDLEPLLEIQSDSFISLSADGGLTLTVGAFLGDAPSSTKLSGTNLLSSIADGIEIKEQVAITAPNDVSTLYGTISGDATFNLSVNGGPDVEVTLEADSTDDNTSISDLASDMNAALTTAGLSAEVSAEAVGNRVNLVALGGCDFFGAQHDHRRSDDQRPGLQVHPSRGRRRWDAQD